MNVDQSLSEKKGMTSFRDRMKSIYRITGIEGRGISARYAATILFVVGLFVGVFGYGAQNVWNLNIPLLRDFYAILCADLTGIGLTVLIIDGLNERRAIEDRKAALILQMGSPDNRFAMEAARTLRVRGWLVDGSLKNADLRKANLTGADLVGANLSGANLQEANLKETNLMNANLSGAYLVEANLNNASLAAANLSGAYLNGANLTNAALTRANLTEAVLRKAVLNETGLEEANLNGASLEGALLIETNLAGANLTGASFFQARYNAYVTWPEGYSPPEDAAFVGPTRRSIT